MSTQGRCGGCDHWKPPDPASNFPAWGECGRVEFWRSDPGPHERLARTEVALVQDGAGFTAVLRCRADYGCVLFEARPSGDRGG